MKSLVCCLLLFASAGLTVAAPLTVAGQNSGPVVVVVSGSGPVKLVHDGKVLREEPSWTPYTAAVILAGPLDSVQWDGKPAAVLAGGSNPVATAHQSLEGRAAPHLYVINTDGSVEELKAPPQPADGETAATAE